MKSLSIIFLSIIGIFGLLPSANAQDIDPTYYYRIVNVWQDGKSIDVANSGQMNIVWAAETGNYTGQMWQFHPVGNGYYRLTTAWQGLGRSLDIVNDGTNNNKPQLATSGNYSGQSWMISPSNHIANTFRLTTAWRGADLALGIINDGNNNRLQLNPKATDLTQYWRFEKVGPVTAYPQGKAPIVQEDPADKNIPIGQKYEKEIMKAWGDLQKIMDKKKKN
jgi:hypothetical protein